MQGEETVSTDQGGDDTIRHQLAHSAEVAAQHLALPTRLNALPCHACFLSGQRCRGYSKEQHKYSLRGTKPIHSHV